jgi:type IX secretion system PorP/SprF family membrane protein
MRSLLSVFIFLLSCLVIDAQQLSHYTNYRFNQFAMNPALAGFKNCLNVNFAYRNQWIGFDGNPKTGFFGANAKLGKDNGRIKHGIGGTIETDKSGPYGRTNINGAYAYHFKWGRDLNASIGLFVGFAQYKFDNAFLNLPPDNNQDPILQLGSQNAFIVPEFTPGLWLYNSKFYFGLSVKSLTGNKLKNIGEEAKLAQHVFMSAGKAYEVGQHTLMIPSAMLTYEPGSFPSLNLNVMLDYKQAIAGGIGTRNGDSVSALLRFKFMNHFTIGYAYDYTTSPIRLASSNTHEISLNIYACPGKFYSGKTPCAAYN